jgi:hypothetical protein
MGLSDGVLGYASKIDPAIIARGILVCQRELRPGVSSPATAARIAHHRAYDPPFSAIRHM